MVKKIKANFLRKTSLNKTTLLKRLDPKRNFLKKVKSKAKLNKKSAVASMKAPSKKKSVRKKTPSKKKSVKKKVSKK